MYFKESKMNVASFGTTQLSSVADLKKALVLNSDLIAKDSEQPLCSNWSSRVNLKIFKAPPKLPWFAVFH